MPLMRREVPLERAALPERFGAQGTPVWKFPSVCPQVDREAPLGGKVGIADVAVIGAFSGVGPHVGLQVVLPDEGALTDTALELLQV